MQAGGVSRLCLSAILCQQLVAIQIDGRGIKDESAIRSGRIISGTVPRSAVLPEAINIVKIAADPKPSWCRDLRQRDVIHRQFVAIYDWNLRQRRAATSTKSLPA